MYVRRFLAQPFTAELELQSTSSFPTVLNFHGRRTHFAYQVIVLLAAVISAKARVDRPVPVNVISGVDIN